MADLRLSYMVAEKESITLDEIRKLICRVFASYFCEDWGYEKELIRNLVDALYRGRIVEADTLNDDLDGEKPLEVVTVSGAEAEERYLNAVKRLHMGNGADARYAEEAAMWPDVLPMDAFWEPELLDTLAALEVGHDLIVSDYLTEMAKREIARTA